MVKSKKINLQNLSLKYTVFDTTFCVNILFELKTSVEFTLEIFELSKGPKLEPLTAF